MNKRDFFTKLSPRLASYKLHRYFGYQKINPITLTYSVTAACQSRCKTCQIGAMFCQDPSRAKQDLKLDEIEKIFSTMKPVYFFNLSGESPISGRICPRLFAWRANI